MIQTLTCNHSTDQRKATKHLDCPTGLVKLTVYYSSKGFLRVLVKCNSHETIKQGRRQLSCAVFRVSPKHTTCFVLICLQRPCNSLEMVLFPKQMLHTLLRLGNRRKKKKKSPPNTNSAGEARKCTRVSGKGNREPFQLSKGLLQTAGREKGFYTLGKIP